MNSIYCKLENDYQLVQLRVVYLVKRGDRVVKAEDFFFVDVEEELQVV